MLVVPVRFKGAHRREVKVNFRLDRVRELFEAAAALETRRRLYPARDMEQSAFGGCYAQCRRIGRACGTLIEQIEVLRKLQRKPLGRYVIDLDTHGNA